MNFLFFPQALLVKYVLHPFGTQSGRVVVQESEWEYFVAVVLNVWPKAGTPSAEIGLRRP